MSLTHADESEIFQATRSVLHQICYDVISKSFDLKSMQFIRSVKKFMNAILLSEEKVTKKDPFGLDEYQLEECLCAYLFRYFFHYSSVVMKCFFNFLAHDKIRRSEFLAKKEIRICCLGGGPASEAIGIGEAIECTLIKEKMDTDVELHISVIDRCKQWKAVALKAVKAAQKHSQLKWKLNFIEEDISQPLSNNCISEVRKADCLTMVNFSSSVFCKKSISKGDPKTMKMVIGNKIEEVLKLTKTNAFIFHLDGLKDHYEDKLTKIISNVNLLKIFFEFRNDSYEGSEESSLTHEIHSSTCYGVLEKFLIQNIPPVLATIWIKTTVSGMKQIEKTIAEMQKLNLASSKRLYQKRRPKPGESSDRNQNTSQNMKGQTANKPPKKISKGSHLAHFIEKESEKKKKANKYRDAAKKASNGRCLRDEDY